MGLKGVSILLLIGGLVWLGAEYVENRNRPSRMRVPAESELSVVTGKAMAGRIVERKSKKGALMSRYTELDVEAPTGLVTVHIGEPHNERVLTGLGGETVTVKFDPNDDKKVYSLKTEDKQVFAYADTAAHKAKLVEGISGNWPGWIALVLGAIGFWLSRKAMVTR